jgi:flagellar protein FliL
MSSPQTATNLPATSSTERKERIMASTLSPVRPGSNGAAADSGAVVPEQPKKSKKKLLIIVVVLLLVGGGAAYKVTKKPAGPAKPKPGPVLKLDDINLNLSGGHYLKIDLALQTTKKAPADIDGSQAMDLAITQFSGVSMETLEVPAKREAAKQQLLTSIEKAYPGQVMDVYFTEFVMQ